MSLSRRKFMKAGAVAAACAAFPLKSAFGRNTPQAGSGSFSSTGMQSQSDQAGLDQLGYYTRSTFAPYVNTQFRVNLTTSSTSTLTLVEVRDRLPATSQTSGVTQQTECFSLLLTNPSGNAFEQNTYLLEHEALGSFYLFLVPISGKTQKGLDYYEAVIYRNPPLPAGYEPPKGTAPERLTVKAQPEPLQTTPLPTNGGAVVVTPSDAPKTEQEVFYFRPDEIKDTTPVEKPDPGAEGRRIASRLTVAQAPAVDHIKLGMSVEQVLALFPGSKDDAEIRSSLASPSSKFGVQSLLIRTEKFSKKKKSTVKANQVALTFLDNRVVTLYMGYESPMWGHVDDYVTQFSGETGLPGADSWDAYIGMDTQLKTLKCRDFEISLFAGGENVNLNYVRMRDLPAQRVLKERRARAQRRNGAKA